MKPITTVKDLNDAINTMAEMMLEKGIVGPNPKFELDQGGADIWLHASSTIGRKDCHVFSGATFDDVYYQATDFIASLPSAEEKATHDYLAKIASAVDFAKDNGIDEAYVKPLRDVSCAMTENLLTHEAKQ